MSVNIDLRVYTGNNVLLPGSQVPRPATVLVSTKTGKIVDVREGQHVRADYLASSSDDDRWTDVRDKYLLPGLVEYVRSSSRLGSVHPIVPNLVFVCLQCACTP